MIDMSLVVNRIYGVWVLELVVHDRLDIWIMEKTRDPHRRLRKSPAKAVSGICIE